MSTRAFQLRGISGLALLFLAACTDLPGDSPPESSVDLAATWTEALPSEVALDEAALVAAGDQADTIPRMRSLLVVRGGRLAYERYFHGFAADSLSDVRSVTKSVVSTLAGLAIDEGYLSLDDPVTEYIASPAFAIRGEHGQITVRHLLTMTGGFQWSETGTTEYNNWWLSGDHVDYLLNRSLATNPGSTFNYNSPAVHLLGVVLESAIGTTLPTYADRVLFGPLGISSVRWEQLSSGPVNGGSGIDLRPRDLARLGQLLLQRGWSGNRAVLPTGWADEATAQRFAGLGSVGPISALSYGYLWWLDLENDAVFAWGYGGQFIYVVPRLDLVIVATTDWRRVSQDVGSSALQEAVLDVVVDGVLPAVR